MSISLNPMNSLAYKCRAKIYHAQAEALAQEEGDECSEDASEDDNKRINLLRQCADDFISGYCFIYMS